MPSTQDIQNAEQLLVQQINDLHPNVDTRKGSAFRNLVVSPAATIYALIREEVGKLSSVYDTSQLNLDDTSVADAVLSNWFLNKDSGTKASGLVKIVLVNNANITFTKGTVLATEDGVEFTIDEDHDFSFTPTSTQEQIFLDSTDNTYFVIIKVTAVEVGSSGNLDINTVLASASSQFLSNILFVETYNKFTGGTDSETSDEFKARLSEAVTVRTLTSKKAIKATLMDAFPSISKISVIGYSDQEMQRDVVFPTYVHTGGAVDIYTANFSVPEVKIKEVLLSGSPTVEIYGTEAPVLRIRSVRLEINGELTDLTENEDYTIERDSYNWYSNFREAKYASKFFARFSVKELTRLTLITGGVLTSLSEALNRRLLIEYDTDSKIHEIQDYLDSDDNRFLMASYLSKSLAPVFVRVALRYKGTVDEAALRQQISDYIYDINPDSELVTVSKIIAIAESLGAKRVILPVEVEADAVTTYGVTSSLYSTDELTIESNPGYGYTSRICQYYCDPQLDITLTKEV